MFRTIVLKLTRMGDILEAAPLLRRLRTAYPNSHTTLVVNETFRGAAELLHHVDHIISFPIIDYAWELRTGDRDLVDLYRQLESFTDQLSGQSYDLAVNVTNSLLSGMLMGFINANEFRGLMFDNQGIRQALGPFVRYFAPNEGNRRHCAFNLSDFMVGAIGHSGAPEPDSLRIPEDAVAEAARLLSPDSRPLLGIQAGASEANKRWRIAAFARTAQLILERTPARLVFLGSTDERVLSDAILEQIDAAPDRAVNLAGQTSLPVLAAVSSKLKALLTNDTGTMHLGALTGPRVVNLSLGSAFFRETGPYGEGHLILEPRIACRPCDFFFECSHMNCKSHIDASDVAALLECILRDLPLDPVLKRLHRVDVYKTTFDREGILHYARLTPRPLKLDEVLLEVFRCVILQSERGGDLSLRIRDALYHLQRDGRELNSGLPIELRRVQQEFRMLELLIEEGMWELDLALEALPSNDLNQLTTLAAAIPRRQATIAEYGRLHDDCRFLVRAFVLEQEAITGATLQILLVRYHASHLRLKMAVRCASQLLDHVLETIPEHFVKSTLTSLAQRSLNV